MIDIHRLMDNLSLQRPIFHLEIDFQFALAWRIQRLIPDRELRLEYRPFASEGVYVDIWIPSEGTILELKYLTEKLEFPWRGEEFSLRSQKANPLRRYDFVRDIERIEDIVSRKKSVTHGYAVLLTNDQSYWKSPSSRWRNTMDAAFRLHENRTLSGDLRWPDNVNPRTIEGREDPIGLSGTYSLSWEDYSDLGDHREGRFRYLAASVGS